MKRLARTPGTPPRPRSRTPHAGGAALMRVDATRIRQKARRDYDQTRRRLARAQAELDAFETADMPLFRKWLHATFAALLSELKELTATIQNSEARLDELEMAATVWRCAPHVAAQRLRNGEKPEWPPDEPEAPPRGEDEDFFALGEDEDDEDKLNDRAAREFARLFGFDPGEPAHHATRARQAPDAAGRTRRVRDLYRQLVRRLHPDARGEAMSPALTTIWHEAQHAYQQQDLEHLEMLQVRLNIETGHDRGESQVSLLRQMTRAVKRTLNALQRRLRVQRRDPAWGFTKLKDRGPLERAVGHAVRHDRDRLRQRAHVLANALETLQQPPHRNRPRRRTRRGDADDILDLPF